MSNVSVMYAKKKPKDYLEKEKIRRAKKINLVS